MIAQEHVHLKEVAIVSLHTSPLPALTEEIAVTAIREFFGDKPFVFFGTGMSCALDTRFGMPSLKDELAANVFPDPQDSEQVQQWNMVMESLQKGYDLETALNNVASATLLQNIMSATGRIISSIDREYALQISNCDVKWPATAFFKRLVDTLPESDRVLHVLTPNYDTLFEHACDSVGILYTSGFFGGLERQIDWSAVNRSMLQIQKVTRGRRLENNYQNRNHVRLYKVHGSLNLFFHRNTVVENNAWMWDAPDFSDRVMITPGLSKHEMLQNYRQELLKPADDAIDKSHRFLFIGYGFNDSHLEAYIKQKLITQACKGLIVTRDSNPRIESLLQQAQNLWLVCKTQEDSFEGTRIFNKQYADWLVLPTRRFWDIETFTTEILGV